MTGDKKRERLGESFWDWGIPTVISLIEVIQSTKLETIASGGIRTGIDAAKAVALGASLASISTPVLRPATENAEEVKKNLNLIIEEFRNTMFLVGTSCIDELRKAPLVILGKTAAWLKRRGFKPEAYARRNLED